MDETGVYWRQSPHRTLTTTRLRGRKLAKERLTLALCCNSDGSDKMVPVLIGKSAKPRAFKGFPVQDWVHYHSNSTSWMKMDIFSGWCRKINTKFANENRKVAKQQNTTSQCDKKHFTSSYSTSCLVAV
jgi:hypothetical protein